MYFLPSWSWISVILLNLSKTQILWVMPSPVGNTRLYWAIWNTGLKARSHYQSFLLQVFLVKVFDGFFFIVTTVKENFYQKLWWTWMEQNLILFFLKLEWTWEGIVWSQCSFFFDQVFIRPLRDVLWYTVVCPSVVHMSDNNSKTL